MARFFRWIVLLALPFVVLLGGTAWVDPFNYFNNASPVPLEVRHANLRHDGATMPYYTLAWKLIEYRRGPVADIIIGDSRLTRFNAALVTNITGRPLYNFGVPGGNAPSMFRTFWYADSLTTLSTVYLQVGFRNWSAAQDYDIVEGPTWATSSAVRYITDRGVLRAAWINALSCMAPDMAQPEPLAPDQWEKVIANERAILDAYVPSTEYATELQRIAAHCTAKGIRLVLIDLPLHDDVHRMMHQERLRVPLEAYTALMRSAGNYYDLSGPSVLTADRAAYIDPLHASQQLLNGVIHEIWQGPLEHGTVYGRPAPSTPAEELR